MENKHSVKIKTIIFDIGNVLMSFGWLPYFRSFGFNDEIIERMKKATVKSSIWGEFDRGVWSDEKVLAHFIKNDPGIENELRKVFTSNMKGMLQQYSYTIPWIQELKAAGYLVLVLSNFAKKTYIDCEEQLDFLKQVDGGILSFNEKLIKPEPEIYIRLLDRYHLKPEECVFLDDSSDNIEAARKLGIHGIVFTDRESALKELQQLGVG